MRTVALLFLLCCVLESVHLVSSVTCYLCAGDYGTACDHFNPSSPQVTTCTGTHCAKLKGKGKIDGTTLSGVARICLNLPNSTTNQCEKISDSENSYNQCLCNTDKCNSGHRGRQFSLITLFISTFIAFLSVKRPWNMLMMFQQIRLMPIITLSLARLCISISCNFWVKSWLLCWWIFNWNLIMMFQQGWCQILHPLWHAYAYE